MGTLLLRIAAPMQAWGDESKYDIRATGKEPTKSGVIGMLAAAMGYRRDSDEVKEMACRIRMGVREDQPGVIIRDFHTARAPKYSKKGVIKYNTDGAPVMEDNSYITQRYYLCDACFLVCLECEDDAYLQSITEALKAPAFSLFLGRRSCPPSLPIVLGVEDTDLETALNKTEWIAPDWYKDKQKGIRARIITETRKGQPAAHVQMDQPVSFSPIHRRYTLRGLNKQQYVILGTLEHDPMKAL